MGIKNKCLLSVMSGLLMSVSADANAAANEIIYKIHDIVPVEENGEVKACEFGITLFNRTSDTISDVKLELGWKDEVIAEAIKNEEKENKEAASEDGRRRRNASTADFTSDMISTTVSIPPMEPAKQVSLKTKIDTDRCFLLMGEVKNVVRSCKVSGASKDKAAGACADLFKFISPQNPEYYTSFSEISYDEKKAEEEKLYAKDVEELNQVYQGAVNSLRKVNKTLTSIRSTLPGGEGVNSGDTALDAEDEVLESVIE